MVFGGGNTTKDRHSEGTQGLRLLVDPGPELYLPSQ